jgi:hypothetical protein
MDLFERDPFPIRPAFLAEHRLQPGAYSHSDFR